MSRLVAVLSRGRRIGHPFKREQAGMASNFHPRLALFDYCVGRGIEDHIAAGALDRDDDYIVLSADSRVLKRGANEWRARFDLDLLDLELEPLGHRSKLHEVRNRRPQ